MDDKVRLKNHKNKLHEEESNQLSLNDGQKLNKLFKSTSTQTDSINIWDFINFPAKFPFVVWPFLVPKPPPPPPPPQEQESEIILENQQLNENKDNYLTFETKSNQYDVANDIDEDEALDDSEDEDEDEINFECDAIEYEVRKSNLVSLP